MSNWGIGFRSGDGDWWFVHHMDVFLGKRAVVTRDVDKVKWYNTEEEAKKDAVGLGPQYWVMGRDAINKMMLENYFGGDVNDNA